MNHSNYNQNIDSKGEKLEEKPIDAIIKSFISKDGLEASIYITPPENGGEDCNFILLRKILSENNITHGVNSKILLDIANSPKYNEEIIVAKGTPPIHGIDGTFDIKFKTTTNLKPKEKEDGSVDFYNLENIVNVEEGQLLCTIVPHTEGKAGKTVTGKKINPIPGKPVPQLLGKNTVLSEDGKRIHSKIEGQVSYLNGRINVNETFTIQGDVDKTTGNIKVVGNVIVHGAIRSGFSVEATGSIQVSSSLGSVNLVAGEDVILHGGIIGGNITCEGDLHSKFIENCKVMIKGDVKTTYIMNSNIISGGNIETINPVSKIVGGKCLAGKNINTKTIGSPANVKTQVEIGSDPKLIEKKQTLEKEISNFEKQKESLTSLIDLLKQFKEAGKLNASKEQSLQDAIYSRNKINDMLENSNLKLEEVNNKMKSKRIGKIICAGILYPGTTIKIGKKCKTFKKTMFSKSFFPTTEGIESSGL